MGFDLIGERAKNKHGEYVRNNVWWWHNLWYFIAIHCRKILTQEEINYGDGNGGKKIVKQKAERIVKKLKETLVNGKAQEFETAIAKIQKAAIEDNKKLKGGCTNSNYNYDENYPFTVENLKRFIQFVENSGGFRIF